MAASLNRIKIRSGLGRKQYRALKKLGVLGKYSGFFLGGKLSPLPTFEVAVGVRHRIIKEADAYLSIDYGLHDKSGKVKPVYVTYGGSGAQKVKDLLEVFPQGESPPVEMPGVAVRQGTTQGSRTGTAPRVSRHEVPRDKLVSFFERLATEYEPLSQ